MQVDVTPLLSEIGNSEEYSLDEPFKLDLGEDMSLKDNVVLEVTVVNSGMGLVAKGRISTIVSLECSICLKQFDEKISFEFEERFVDESKKYFSDEKDYEVQNDDVFFTYSSDLTIDFSEMARELIILNLPIAPKCDINCQVQKQEEKKTIDPRLAVLEQLKKTED